MHFVNVHNEYAEAGKQIQYTINYCHTVRTLLCFGNSAFLLTLLSGVIFMLWITCAGLRHQYPYYRYRYHHTLVLYNNVFVINYSANHCASITLISKPVGCSRPLLLMQYVIIKNIIKQTKDKHVVYQRASIPDAHNATVSSWTTSVHRKREVWKMRSHTQRKPAFVLYEVMNPCWTETPRQQLQTSTSVVTKLITRFCCWNMYILGMWINHFCVACFSNVKNTWQMISNLI